jgi:hypothetical protein
MKQRGFLGLGRRDLELRVGARQERLEAGGPRPLGRTAPDEEDQAQLRQVAAQRLHVTPVKPLRGDQHPRRARPQTRADRLRTEGGEERRVDAAVLERSERGDEKLRDSPQECADALTPPHAVRAEDVREAVRERLQLGEGEVTAALRTEEP